MEYLNYIDGKWVKSSGKTFDSLNPATEQIIGKFQKSKREDVLKAISAAKTAFPAWRDMPAPKRAEYLWKIKELLVKDKEKLARLEVKEMGKVISEARGDVQEAIDVFEYMAGEGRRLFGHTAKSELPNKFAMTIRNPIGVVGLITPWNFPIAIPAWKIAPALVCGNSIVFKPSSDTPLCAIELAKIIEKAGVPKGVFNLITGSGADVGDEIIRNKDVLGISFTGSKTTGEMILKTAGVKKVGLELGGKNAIIINEDANLQIAVDGVLWGAFGTTGQRCTATSRVIVHDKVKKKFEGMLLERVKKLKLGDGMKADVGPLINKSAVEKSQRYVQIGQQEGAKLLHGGEARKIKGKGFFFEPTIFTDCKSSMRICQQEIFGPVLSIISVKNMEEAIEIANDVEYGLSSAIYTENMKVAFDAINKIETGITYINSSTIGAEVHLPFGGVKGTGNTREAGIQGIDEFSETKTVYFDYSGKLQKAQGID
ncbi:aldehyde dehydrogenase [Candidatus Pacearchaeota archaeon CG_4_9_14_0_2_um_filter_39_13]|nr:MAG: aldehyde dehydrogenase [Candidatus Pacearchaeota archaeon CG_4_9_14_0_2_um_filter_39_13]